MCRLGLHVHTVLHLARVQGRSLGVLLTKKSGKCFRVGIFLDFASSSTRTPHGVHAQMGGRLRIGHHWGGFERLTTRTLCSRKKPELGAALYLQTSGKINRERRSIRFRLAPRTCARCGPPARVVPGCLTKSRKIPTRKTLRSFSRRVLGDGGWEAGAHVVGVQVGGETARTAPRQQHVGRRVQACARAREGVKFES